MNKKIVQLARRNLEERRSHALDVCEQALQQLRSDDEWRKCEYSLRKAQVDAVMSDGNNDRLQQVQSDCRRRMAQLLKKHGLTNKDITPQFACKQCGDTGYTADGEMCKCLRDEIRRLTIAESDIPHKEYTFEASKETDKHNLAIYKKALQVCRDGNMNMLLIGDTGCGKTYLLNACANCCAQDSRSTLFLTAYALTDAFLNAHLGGIQARQDALDNLIDVDVLIIDDLGTESIYKNVTVEYLFAVINERISRKKQTFVSTNLTLTALRDRYDERIFSRLVDQNLTFVAQLVGSDKRLKGGA